MRYLCLMLLTVCTTLYLAMADEQPDLRTVPYVDVGRYAGSWYEIASNPMEYTAGCFCTRQNLTALPDGKLDVYNSCNLEAVNGPLSEIRGTATNIEPSTNAKFEVDFGMPELGKYWIIALDPDYNWAVVSEPSKKALFVLSKTPTMAPAQYQKALDAAATQVSVESLQLQTQAGCSYP